VFQSIRLSLLTASVLLAGIASAAPATNGLAAYWDFDEGKGDTLHDKSGNGNHGVITKATWAPGVSGSALSFTGDGYVDCGHGPSLNVTGAITLAAWINLGEKVLPSVSFGFRDIINKPGAYQLGVVKEWGLTFSALNGGRIYRGHDADSEFAVNRWYHVAVSYNTVYNERRIYIDGVEQPAGNVARVFGIDSSANNLRIGNQAPGKSWGNSNHWRGKIDEVRIYNRVLSPTEVVELYQIGAGKGSAKK
jgi:hypothetical protein